MVPPVVVWLHNWSRELVLGTTTLLHLSLQKFADNITDRFSFESSENTAAARLYHVVLTLFLRTDTDPPDFRTIFDPFATYSVQ
jgi:hypothetical protein